MVHSPIRWDKLDKGALRIPSKEDEVAINCVLVLLLCESA